MPALPCVVQKIQPPHLYHFDQVCVPGLSPLAQSLLEEKLPGVSLAQLCGALGFPDGLTLESARDIWLASVEQSIQRKSLIFGKGVPHLSLLAYTTISKIKEAAKYNETLDFDTTYQVNRFKYPLGFLVGMDGNRRSCVWCSILFCDESLSSIMWFFADALPQIVGLPTLSGVNLIVTDGDNEFAAAINSCILRGIFPSAQHALCYWHTVSTPVSSLVSEQRGKIKSFRVGFRRSDRFPRLGRCNNRLKYCAIGCARKNFLLIWWPRRRPFWEKLGSGQLLTAM